MDDSAEYRHVKRRRYITVALSVSLTTVLCVGYVVADIFDKLPGVLTLQEVEHATAKTPGNAIAAATMVGGLDASKTVDAVAAKALISQFETAASDLAVNTPSPSPTRLAMWWPSRISTRRIRRRPP